MKELVRLRVISIIAAAYLLLALGWWSMLLFTKNKDAFYAKRDLLHLGMMAQGTVKSNAEFTDSVPYQNLEKAYQRQERMILGESLVLAISLLYCIWLINRGYNKEVQNAKHRRNFLLSITHELKSPLSSIQLVLSTLQKRQITDEQRDKMFAHGNAETERLKSLVNDLLLSAKLETAYQPYLEPVNLVTLHRNIIQRLQTKHPDASFQLKTASEDIMLQADAGGISSVITNLLENAIKYSPAPAAIGVELSPTPGGIRWTVSDEGMGIPDGEKKRIFNRFYRIGSEETRTTKGTGLGLYIVHEIIKSHGGSIRILDNTPRGATFEILLPQ